MPPSSLGLRRQSEAATALSSGRKTFKSGVALERARAVSRCACHRSPWRVPIGSSSMMQHEIGFWKSYAGRHEWRLTTTRAQVYVRNCVFLICS
jgi:hypothetical protein